MTTSAGAAAPPASGTPSATALALAQQVADLRKRLDRLSAGQTTAQLPYSSIEQGSFVMAYDAAGQARMRVGFQSDGTAAVTYSNGPTPPTPTPPVVSARQLGVFVAWDGTFTNQATKPADFLRVDVHMSTTQGFTPDGTTIVGTMPDAGGILVGADCTPHYVCIVAVTHAKDDTGVFVASTPTSQVAVTALPASQIASQAIGADELDADFVLASRIVIGNPYGAHLEIEGRDGMPAGMTLYDNGLAPTVSFDAATGNATIRGTFRTAVSGPRIAVNEYGNNAIDFYPDDTLLNGSSIAPYIYTSNGKNYGGILMAGPADPVTTITPLLAVNNLGGTVQVGSTQIWVYSNSITLDVANNGGYLHLWNPSSGNYVEFGYGTAGVFGIYPGSGYATQFFGSGNFSIYGSGHGACATMAYGSNYVQVQAGRLDLAVSDGYVNILTAGSNNWQFAYNSVGVSNNSSFLVCNTTGLDVKQSANGSWLAVGASAFVTQTSTRATKTEIESLPFDPDDVIAGAPSSQWAHRVGPRDEQGRRHKHVSPMVDDLLATDAAHVLVRATGDGDNTSHGISLGSQVGVVWAASAKHRRELDDLDRRLRALEPA